MARRLTYPKNIHDITKASLSYSVCATNMMDMMPKSMVDSCIGFADQLQLTHLKIQQAVAKAKPDGIIIDIEGLENVQLGRENFSHLSCTTSTSRLVCSTIEARTQRAVFRTLLFGRSGIVFAQHQRANLVYTTTT